MKTIYAVVDLETTGTDTKTDRIIQFGCVLVQNGQIINRFATYINPGRRIPKKIQTLTHIYHSEVKTAPFFDDVAATIYNLLAGTVFVAHNIYFDFNFLNEELTRCGFPRLQLSGIDTVELAQVFLPTESSFRLNDLAESLGLSHENPHQADSDAEVTAALLLYIEAIMKELPLVTMEKIYQLSDHMSMQTNQFIYGILVEMRQKPRPLAPELEIIEEIALRKKSVNLFEAIHYKLVYPKTKKEKTAVFAGMLAYRKAQARLMNGVYDHFQQTEEKNLIIEAETGMGKTIGYLFPANYLVTPENPLIISTSSILLQQQILQKDIPLLNQFLAQPIHATVVKSHRHYIDLQRFKATLKQPVAQKQYAQYQMTLLVWLTKTETGDFDELNLVRLDHPLFIDIRHRGVDFLAAAQPFYREDFVRHLYNKMRQSNMLIINHAFLIQENFRQYPALPKSDYLLIDEAQHLPEVAAQFANTQFDSLRFRKNVLQMTEEGLLTEIFQLVAQEEELRRLLTIYQELLLTLLSDQASYFETLTEINEKELAVVSRSQIRNETLYQDRLLQKIQQHYLDILEVQRQLTQSFTLLFDKWLNGERILLARLFDFFQELVQQETTFRKWSTQWQPRYIHWLKRNPDGTSGTIGFSDLQIDLLAESKWYQRYQRIIYLGGTLKVPGDKTYFARQLGIPQTRIKSIPKFYDYSLQARLLISKETLPTSTLDNGAFVKGLVEALRPILKQNKLPTLVLFTSHEVLKGVYEQLHMELFNEGREIVAQGMGGSREKVVKRFLLADSGILFGTDSFWEGIDLPGEALKLVVVTRLPFENPKRPLVQARHAFFEQLGLNAFTEDSLPKATLRLRQALGRLIRSEDDRGILIILDRRIRSAKYGKRMLKSLPKDLPIVEESPLEMSKTIATFFEKQDET